MSHFQWLTVLMMLIVLGWISVSVASSSPMPTVAPKLHEANVPASAVICEPLFVCDIVFDPKERILNIAAGDTVRWIFNLVPGSADGDAAHIVVKATEFGLRTNLIVTTDKRTCYILLVSPTHKYQTAHFYYPVAKVAHIEPNLSVDPRSSEALENLDFGYRLKGERSFMPLHIMNDGLHTYIEMPNNLQDMPVLYVIGNDGSDTIANYRLHGHVFILDGVPERIALVQGSGRAQRRVVIERVK